MIYNHFIHPIGTEGSASDGGELVTGVDVFDNGFVETGEVFVTFFEHGLHTIWLNVETYHCFFLRLAVAVCDAKL